MMRYIKLFEGFEDEYYYQISYPEEMKLYNYDGKHGNKEIFTIEEINWLKDNLVINEWLYGMGKYSYQLDNLDPWGCRFNPRGKVYKLRDEWFVVEFMRDEFSKKLHAISL